MVRTTDPLATRLFVMLGSYGPALAAVIVRALSRERFGTTPLWQRLAAGLASLTVALFAGCASMRRDIAIVR